MSLKINYATSAILIAIPLYTWYKCMRKWKKLRDEYDRLDLYYNRHNCVVMYTENKGMSGWPDHPKRLKLTLSTFRYFMEPLIYFINTSERSLDIAVMILNIMNVKDAIVETAKRGVAVRVILDESFDHDDFIKDLVAAGVQVLCHSFNREREAYMHYKFAIKDYCDEDGSGFSVCGSLNWTKGAITNNYENLVFSSQKSIVEELHKNFECVWEYAVDVGVRNCIINDALNDHTL